ncbi:MAG: hypothetical protein N3F63_07090 [Thermoplasmata archaeon]|nr:hypothetical protein [Thermoplasmata archaeon]
MRSLQRKRITLISRENKAVIFLGAGALLFTFWISGVVLNLSTQYSFNFEFWEAGIFSLGLCSALTLFPALVLTYLGLKIRREIKGEKEKGPGG